ncbi:hypothetical protein DPEC_G00326140 [Dallia pectoralis]|uniref:Uncharacterized protein n=1 Tax=Dallia pectoralis TaxID=75939 RepID=A0ACC2F7R6_DALPE|nr:hypothetical protein DPEC_G00326140 [Dallia pectoralis]
MSECIMGHVILHVQLIDYLTLSGLQDSLCSRCLFTLIEFLVDCGEPDHSRRTRRSSSSPGAQEKCVFQPTPYSLVCK